MQTKLCHDPDLLDANGYFESWRQKCDECQWIHLFLDQGHRIGYIRDEASYDKDIEEE